MIINILILLPLVMSVIGIFFDNGVFIANLFVVPLALLFLILKSGRRFLFIFSIPLLVVLLYFLFFQDIKKTLYLAFETLAVVVMLVLPTRFFTEVKPIQLKLLSYTSIFFVVIYFLLAFQGNYWFEDRYIGPLLNTNLSVYFLLFSLLFLSVSFPIGTNYGLVFIVIFVMLALFAYQLSQSRSVFFFMPAFFYLIIKRVNLKHTAFLMGFAFLFILGGGQTSVSEPQGRFDSDETSFVTRAVIIEALVDELIEARGIPRGPRYTTDFVVKLTENDEMHAHNDLISGIIDYGPFFLFAIFYFIFLIRKLSKDSWFSGFALVAYISCALHGYLFGCVLLISLLGVVRQNLLLEK